MDEDLERLLETLDAEVHRLRGYVSDLKDGSQSRHTCIPAIRRFARRFSELTGIEVDVHAPSDLSVNDRLGTELFEIAVEALSNIRRHTTAEHASVFIERFGGTITVRVENDDSNTEVLPFTPLSLAEHAHAFGGSLDVTRVPGQTAVVINIPL